MIIVTRELKLWQLLMVMLLTTAALWLNVSRQSTAYGTGDGKFADQVDSFSEYEIRNTVLHRALGNGERIGSLILARGYPQGDYAYYPDQYSHYYSNRGAQTQAYYLLAAIDKAAFLRHPDAYFQAFRLINCALLVACVSAFFFCAIGTTVCGAGAVVLFCFSGGLCLFCSNLYYCLWLMYTPLLSYPLVAHGQQRTFVAAAFFFSLLHFAVRYEFATTFALLWLLPVMTCDYLSARKPQLGLMACTFAAVILAFAVALALHHLAVADELGVSMVDASRTILASVHHRMASTDGVPTPLSPDFLHWFVRVWGLLQWPALKLPTLLIVSKLSIVVIFLLCLARERKTRLLPLFLWAGAAYWSWYVFAYQQMMWHDMYDSLVFAATLQLFMVFYLAHKTQIAMRSTMAPTGAVRRL